LGCLFGYSFGGVGSFCQRVWDNLTLSNMARGALFVMTMAATGIVEWGGVGSLAQEQSCNIDELVTGGQFHDDSGFLNSASTTILVSQVVLVSIYLIERVPALLRNTSIDRFKKNFELSDNLRFLKGPKLLGFVGLSSCLVIRSIGTVIRNYESSGFALRSLFNLSDEDSKFVAPFVVTGLFLNSVFFNLGVFIKGIADFCAKPNWRRVFGIQYFCLGFFTASSLCYWLYHFIQHHGKNPVDHLAEIISLFLCEFVVSLFMSGSVVEHVSKILSKLRQYPFVLSILIFDIMAWMILNSWQSYNVSVNLFSGSSNLQQYPNSTSLQDTCEFIRETSVGNVTVHYIVTAITAIPAFIATYLFALYQTKDLLGIKLERADDEEMQEGTLLLPMNQARR